MKFQNICPSRRIALLAGAAFTILLALTFAARSPGAPPPPAPAGAQRIAVANLARIFGQMRETKDIKDQLEAKNNDFKAQQEKKSAAIKDIREDLRNLKPDTPPYDARVKDLDNALADLETWGKVTQVEADRDQKKMMKKLFEKIEAAVAEVAKQQGYDLVLADQSGDFPLLEKNNLESIRGYINQQSLLYADKRLDITDAVLTQLDADYAKEKGAK